MNREFRNIDRATDVLSFSMIEYETPGEFDFLEDRSGLFDPETGRLLLGDIVISKGEVLSQAEDQAMHPGGSMRSLWSTPSSISLPATTIWKRKSEEKWKTLAGEDPGEPADFTIDLR